MDNNCVNALPKVLLWGGKSQSRLIAEMLHELGIGEARVIFDTSLTSLEFQTQASFINDTRALAKSFRTFTHYVVCVGAEYGFARTLIANYLEQFGLLPLRVIHSSSYVDSTSAIGSGCQIMPGAVIHKFVQMGNQCIVNSNATIDHECSLGHGVHVMGSAAIAGRVVVHDYATIGTNATILPEIVIGEGAFVGAGAVVTKDVAPYTVVTGVPAVTMRTIKPIYDDIPIIELSQLL